MAAVSATFYSDRTRRVLRLSEALVKMSGRHVTGRQEGSAPDISSLGDGARGLYSCQDLPHGCWILGRAAWVLMRLGFVVFWCVMLTQGSQTAL